MFDHSGNLKYKNDILHVTHVLIIMESWENNGMGEIGL